MFKQIRFLIDPYPYTEAALLHFFFKSEDKNQER